jgi:hypothetical protein
LFAVRVTKQEGGHRRWTANFQEVARGAADFGCERLPDEHAFGARSAPACTIIDRCAALVGRADRSHRALHDPKAVSQQVLEGTVAISARAPHRLAQFSLCGTRSGYKKAFGDA